jgi:hypothetical protein
VLSGKQVHLIYKECPGCVVRQVGGGALVMNKGQELAFFISDEVAEREDFAEWVAGMWRYLVLKIKEARALYEVDASNPTH